MFDCRPPRAFYLACLALALAPFACQTGVAADQGRSTDDCSDACARVAVADCGDVGSSCVDQCLRGPTPLVTASRGDCAKVETAYLDCFWSAAAYACDETLGTLPVGCDAERDAVRACESVGAAGAGGAAGGAGNESVGATGAGAAGAGGAAGAAGNESAAVAGAGGAP